MNTKRYLLAYCTEFDKCFSSGGPNILLHVQWEMLIITNKAKNAWLFGNITKISYVPWTLQISILSSWNGSLESLKTFWLQGCESVNRVFCEIKKQFWKIVVILTIFGKSTIFQSPLKSVDEAWHRRYKISDLRNHSIITTQNIM